MNFSWQTLSHAKDGARTNSQAVKWTILTRDPQTPATPGLDISPERIKPCSDESQLT